MVWLELISYRNALIRSSERNVCGRVFKNPNTTRFNAALQISKMYVLFNCELSVFVSQTEPAVFPMGT